jgi:hypothetical protein
MIIADQKASAREVGTGGGASSSQTLCYGCHRRYGIHVTLIGLLEEEAPHLEHRYPPRDFGRFAIASVDVALRGSAELGSPDVEKMCCRRYRAQHGR